VQFHVEQEKDPPFKVPGEKTLSYRFEMILGCVNNVIIIIFGCIIPLKWYPLLISHSQVILVF